MEEIREYYNNCLELTDEISSFFLKNYFEDHHKRILVLKIGAYFESYFERILKKSFINNLPPEFSEFAFKEGVEKQFYKIFNFDIQKHENGANKFFNKFGKEFSNKIKEKLEKEGLKKSIGYFILLVRERNKLIHTRTPDLINNYTFKELLDLFEEANKFFKFLEKELI